jgi:hypothetical protein
MIALYTFAPQFCPFCGCRLAQDRGEWANHVSYLCGGCRTAYQLVDEQHAIEAATASGGDLERVYPLTIR